MLPNTCWPSIPSHDALILPHRQRPLAPADPAPAAVPPPPRVTHVLEVSQCLLPAAHAHERGGAPVVALDVRLVQLHCPRGVGEGVAEVLEPQVGGAPVGVVDVALGRQLDGLCVQLDRLIVRLSWRRRRQYIRQWSAGSEKWPFSPFF